MELDFSIFTLNIWGIPLGISKNLNDRISALCDFLKRKSYDCVCLQEVWTEKQFDKIREKLMDVLPYSHYFYSGAFGSGVCIFSKYPIEDAFFHQWSLNGYIHKIQHGDWFGGKGIGVCRIVINQYTIHIYSAHLHAEYNPKNDEYRVHRLLQAFDTAQLIRFTSKSADLVVLAGDLNTEPNSLAYDIMRILPGLQDAFHVANPNCFKDNTGQTCETTANSYTPESNIKALKRGQRIDFILYHEGYQLKVKLKKCVLPLPNRIPGRDFSYSDHEAVEATLQITDERASKIKEDFDAKCRILEKTLLVFSNELDNLVVHRRYYSFCAIAMSCILIGFLFITAPTPYNILVTASRVVIGICMIYSLVMATIWNLIERSAIMAGINSMELLLENLKKKKSWPE